MVSTDKLRKRLIADAVEEAVNALTLGGPTEVHRVNDNQVQLRVETGAGVKYYLVTVTAPI
jgi:putative component of toxin-antitoxin plasmid stabilization module